MDHSAPGTFPTSCISYKMAIATQRIRIRVRIRIANGTSALPRCFLGSYPVSIGWFTYKSVKYPLEGTRTVNTHGV